MAKPGTFKKGNSGNPKGRTPLCKDVTELARKEAPEAFKRIVEASRILGPDVKAYVYTNNLIVERAYGKAAQSVQVTGEDGGPVRLTAVIQEIPRKESKELPISVLISKPTLIGE